MVEKLTDSIAVVGVGTIFFPDLWQWTEQISQLAALLMPPMGVAWLAVQIWAKIFLKDRKS